MSDRRHRPGGGGGTAKKLLTWGAWAVLVLLLGANIVMYAFGPQDDGADPAKNALITPERLQIAGLWLPGLAAMTLSAYGIYWASKAYAQNERSSLLWAKRGCIFSLVAVAFFLLVVVFDPDHFPREWMAVVAIMMVAGQTTFLAMLAFREFKRADGGEPGRRGRRGADDTPLLEVPAAPAETPRA